VENQPTTYSSQLDLAALLQQLTHSDQGVRRRAALTLGQLKARGAVGGDKRALPALEWAQTHDKEPIFDRKSTRGKSVSDVAAKAIARIKAQAQS
jgi:HEAT repeat protein